MNGLNATSVRSNIVSGHRCTAVEPVKHGASHKVDRCDGGECARVERRRVVQHVVRDAFAIGCRIARRLIGRAKNLLAPRELLRGKQLAGSQLADRNGR